MCACRATGDRGTPACPVTTRQHQLGADLLGRET